MTGGDHGGRGILISFDGLDSSGKATQARKLYEKLAQEGFEAKYFSTPDYTTASGQELKLRLQNKLGDWNSTSWKEKMSYFADNRAEHKEEVMTALDRGEVVIYDRYVPSSIAFMTVEARQEGNASRQLVREEVEKTEYTAGGMPKEDISFFLDVPPKLSDALLQGRKKHRADQDEYTDHLHVQEALYDEYMGLCREEPERFVRVECADGDKLKSIEEISGQIWNYLRKRFSIFSDSR